MSRTMWSYVVFATLLTGLGCAGPEADLDGNGQDDEVGPRRTMAGYSSELSARPGDTVEFMASLLGGGSYGADLVRVVNGDSVSRYAEHFEVVEVEAGFAGTYEGIEQDLNLGSYVHVAETGALEALESFTVSAWIFPTFDPTEYEPPDLENPDPWFPPTLNIAESVRDQTIVSRFDKEAGKGWALRIDPEFHLELVAGDGSGEVIALRMGEKVRDWDWAYVAASYDASTGEATIHLREKPYAPGDQFTARTLQASGSVGSIGQQGPVRIAAVRDGSGAARSDLEKPGDVFNGRIQDVRVADRVLTADEVDAMASEMVPTELAGSVVADWDFGQGIGTTRIHDVSGNDLHGVVLNIPDRAVRGRFWNGSTVKWTDDPDQYDAITFHCDDLYDAQWASDFSYTVPEDLPSAVYAARLQRGDFTEYITFFVAAPKGRPRADLAVWMSDYNYLAYANITVIATAASNYPGHNLNPSDVEFYKENLTYGTGSVYNNHVDGLYFSYGTRLRPDLHMKPGAVLYNFTADTHIPGFLEHEGIAYDIITDELVDEEGVELLLQYRAVVSATHPEYPTVGIFDAVSEYTASGGRFLYLGGNGWFWSVDGHPTLPGVVESRNFHDIPDRYLTSGARGGMMVETGRYTGPIFGNEMSGMIFNGSSPYRRLEDAANPRAAWIFEGTSEGEVFGNYGIDKVRGGAAGFEIDKFNPGNGVPRHALHLATTEPLMPTIEDAKIGQLPLTISYHPAKGDPWAAADLVFFETPNGGAVFSTGSITWIGSVFEGDYDNDVAKITGNVVRRFIDPTPFPPIESAEVEDVDRVPGNPEYEWADQH